VNATTGIDGLRKRFGPAQALDEMTVTVHPGQVIGFAGPDGAGTPAPVRASPAWTPRRGHRHHRRPAVPHPEEPAAPCRHAAGRRASQPSRTARNQLLWLAHSQGLKSGQVDELIALAGPEPAARRKAGGYCLGMRQRPGIAAALPGDPPALLFDELYNGTDPEVTAHRATLEEGLHGTNA
jgi:ABC-2 type transport system ATP-binding protein